MPEPINPIPNTDPSAVSPPPPAQTVSGFKLTGLEITLILVLAILLVIAWIWALPAYKKVVTDRDDYKTKYEYATAHVQTVIKKVYVHGVIASETDETVSNTTAGQGSSEDRKDHQETITKRGGAGFGLGAGTGGSIDLLLRADVLGPIGIAVEGDTKFKEGRGFVTLSL